MLKELNLSDEYLKAMSGKFDIDTVFNIVLIDKSKQITNKKIKKLRHFKNRKHRKMQEFSFT